MTALEPGLPVRGELDEPTVVIRSDRARPVGDRTVDRRRRLAYAFLIGYALLMFIPFVWTVVTSFKTDPDALQLTWIPDPFTLQGWETAFTQLDPALPRLFLNSLIIAGAVTVSNVVLGSMAGYAFARLRFPGRDLLFVLVLASLMIPDQLRLVPVYLMLNNVVDLVNSSPINYLSVIVVLAVQVESVFLLRQYFLTIPRELEEAAKIDGAGFFTIFARIILPLGGPAIAAVAILQFQGAWNNFFWPLVLLQEQSHWTLPLGLAQFNSLYLTNWPALCAVIVMATLPILILYLFFQRYFVAGVATSGLK
ncbi:MAG TPA: carbohydrate ABC transporter permease [Candidatus Saccharimonadales bacterium]|nr:carbohydrate ABC transporter permease [Candidatus Saccharimonadales bacterium]